MGIALKISAKNSLGGSVISYHFYSYEENGKKFELLGTVPDLNYENTYTYLYSTDKNVEITLRNAVRLCITETIDSEDSELSDESIKRINALSENDKLENVTVLNKTNESSATLSNSDKEAK